MNKVEQFQSVRKYSKGTVIVREGDPGDEMYILAGGSAGMYKNYQTPDELLMATLTSGSFFGEMSLFLNQKRPATIVALSDVTTLVIAKKNALDVFGKQPNIVYSIMGELCNRIDALNTNYYELYNLHYGISAPPATSQTASKASSLFPEKHGSYTLPMLGSAGDYLYPEKFTCPLCKRAFESPTVLSTRLKRAGTDRDLRVRYKDIEPAYYEIISCPNCLYSAPNDLFRTASKGLSTNVDRELGKYKLEVEIKTGSDRDTFTIFAGYYLAILCVPICFDDSDRIVASLWKKLANLYSDCADDAMFRYASEKALRAYEHVYEYVTLSDAQTQQLCYVIGDLHERLEDYNKARNFFFMAKTNRAGTNIMQLEADNRLEEIKLLMKD